MAGKTLVGGSVSTRSSIAQWGTHSCWLGRLLAMAGDNLLSHLLELLLLLHEWHCAWHAQLHICYLAATRRVERYFAATVQTLLACLYPLLPGAGGGGASVVSYPPHSATGCVLWLG
jgi:hypothetical protein